MLYVGSTVVKGIVFRKNVAHKRMTSRYKNPRLLLLAGALEYQRVSNQLSSLDTLLIQASLFADAVDDMSGFLDAS